MSGIKIVPVFKAGTLAKVTKILSFASSEVEVGYVMKGKLRSDVREGNMISFIDGGNTRPLVAVSGTKDGDLIAVTGTSVYFVQKL